MTCLDHDRPRRRKRASNRFGPWEHDEDAAASLSARELEGIFLERWLAWRDDWTPEPQACHANADRWIAQHAGWTMGQLVDVTLRDAVLRRFPAHLRNLQTCARRVGAGRWAVVREPMPGGVN